MIKRILVGLAGTEYTGVAVRRAVELAKIHKAEVTGVTILDPANLHSGSVPAGAGGVAMELREHLVEVSRENVLNAIANFEETCAREQIPCKTQCETGKVFLLINQLARFHDCTIFGLRSVFEYYFEDTDSSKLMARFLGGGVRPIIAAAKNYRPIKKVLLSYSGSMESARTIRRFIQERMWPDIELKIVTFGYRENEAQERLADAAAYCQAHGYDSQTEFIRGLPATGLMKQAAAWDADLIVLGNSTRSYFSHRIFGNTTVHAIKNADRALYLSN